MRVKDRVVLHQAWVGIGCSLCAAAYFLVVKERKISLIFVAVTLLQCLYPSGRFLLSTFKWPMWFSAALGSVTTVLYGLYEPSDTRSWLLGGALYLALLFLWVALASSTLRTIFGVGYEYEGGLSALFKGRN